MSEFQTAQERLAKTPLKDLKALAQAIDVPWTTLYKIKRGETKNPRIETAEKLTKYYRGS
jgi:predicted transcriptional regulator